MTPIQHSRVGTTAAYAALLLVLVVAGTPTRVGDGGEYLAMAMSLSRGAPPALSPDDLAGVDRRFSR